MLVKCTYMVSKGGPEGCYANDPTHALPPSLPPSLPPLRRTLNRAGNKPRLLLLQIVEDRRGVLPVHVHLVHDGESGLEPVLDVLADFRGGVRLLTLGREGGREGEIDLMRKRGRKRGRNGKAGERLTPNSVMMGEEEEEARAHVCVGVIKCLSEDGEAPSPTHIPPPLPPSSSPNCTHGCKGRPRQ